MDRANGLRSKTHRRVKASIKGATLTALAMASYSALAADFSWVPAGPGSFSYGSSTNWTQPGAPTVPGTSDQAIFANNFSGTVTFDPSLGASTISFRNTAGAITLDLQGNPFSLDKILLLGSAAGEVNDVTIAGGGVITQTSSVAQSLLTVGFNGSHGNRLTLSGANTTLLGRTTAGTTGGNVGVAGSNNNVFTVRDGASFLQSADIIVGTVGVDASTGNVMNILNGSTFGSNSVPANGLRGFQLVNGTLNITNSTFQSIRFNASLAGNDTTISFNSGTWMSRACSVLNGKVFTIGDGGALPATYFAVAGNATLLTGNGVLINSNGVLSGTAPNSGALGGIGGNVSGIAGAKISPYSLGGNLFSSADDNPISVLCIKGNLNHQNIETTLQLGDMSSAIVNNAAALPADQLIVTAGTVTGQAPTPAGAYNFDGGTFTHGGSVVIDLGVYKAPQDPGREVRVINWSNTSGDPADTSISFIGGSPLPYDFRSDGLYITLPAVVANSTWAVDADGNWGTASNWDGPIPYGVDATVNFGTLLTAPHTVNSNVNVSAGTINFTQPVGYNITGGSTITMDVLSGSAAINVSAGSHNIGASIVLNDNLNVDVVAGSTLGITGGLTSNGASNLTKSNAGLLILGRTKTNALTIAGGTVQSQTNGTSGGQTELTSLSIQAASTLDITNNALSVNYTGPSVLGDIKSKIIVGFASGSWTGEQITSSSAAAVAASTTNFNKTGIGFAEASSLGSTPDIFSGASIDGDTVLVRYTLYGDANLDGVVNSDDFTALANHFNLTGDWVNGDFNYDGVVNALDFNAISTNFGAPLASLLPGAAMGALVPEPVGVAAVAVISVLGIRRRR